MESSSQLSQQETYMLSHSKDSGKFVKSLGVGAGSSIWREPGPNVFLIICKILRESEQVVHVLGQNRGGGVWCADGLVFPIAGVTWKGKELACNYK